MITFARMYLVFKENNVNTSSKHLKYEGRKNILFYFKKFKTPNYSDKKMKESPKTDPMLGRYQLLNIPACIDIDPFLKKSYKSGGSIDFYFFNSHKPVICKGFLKSFQPMWLDITVKG